jgi:serine/threonine protein kinase
MEQLIGKTLNRYTILELLGKGGIGAVYWARDSLLQRDVAVKVLSPEFARRPNFQERFLQEARAAARLDHTNIVRVHDFGRATLRGPAAGNEQDEDNSYLYIVMEYIPGDNLRKMLDDLRANRQWVLLAEAIQIVHQIAQALEVAHSQGVLHLDIKPANLMLKPAAANGPESPTNLPYRVIITDLGLAQLVGVDQVAQDDGSMGTPAYMSPEQALGQKTDARSDVYSLGVLLFELSTGRVPYPARTIAEAARYHTHEPTPSPRSIRPDLPVALDRVILKALQKDPNLRYASAGEMGQALENVLPAISEVAFRPEEVTQTISLMTQYENTVAEDPLATNTAGRVEAFEQSRPRNARDFVEILLPDHTVRTIPMKPDGLTIGRDPDNDIVLDNVKISRHHARIQFDGADYWASDLNSKNGTFIANQRLIPGEPEQWTPDKGLQIGDFWLRLRQPAPETLPVTGAQGIVANAAETVANENPVRSASSAERIGLFVETVQLSATPGASVTARLVVVNQGPVIDQFRISIAGIPVNWIPNPPPVLRLTPGAQQDVDVTIHPPLSPLTRPGRYPLTFRASGQSAPDRQAEVEAILTVGVFTQFTSELRPRQIWADGAINVTVQNGGNARQAFVITPADRVDEVVFDPPQAQIALAEGETATAEFVAAPRRPRLFGGTRAFPFSVQVATPSGETQTHNGEVLTNGIIPLWVLPVLLLVCLCAAGLAAYGYIDVLQGPARARQTALAGTQAAFMTQTAVLAAANEGTLAVLTATAAWNTQDTDGDGLPNGEELRLGADPNKPDTDGDTIPDGFEVIQFKCTDPTKPDTDGDGLPDNQDPDPCAASTATFTPTPITPSPVPSTSTPTSTNVPIVVTDTPVPATPTFTLPPDTATPTNTPQPQITATPLGGSYIVVFETNRDGNYEIYAMLGDGTRQTRVTNIAGDDHDPALSPDGLRTVFSSNRDGNDEIYVMNVDGTAQTRLTNLPGADTAPAWSPDGSRIAFVSDRDGNKEIYVMSADGSGQTRLTNNAADDDHPAWSPDGTLIVFDSDDGNGRDIVLMNAAGAGVTPLVDNGAGNQHPVFSPNGSRIAYASDITGSSEVYLMNPDGSGQTQLTNLGLSAFNPEWSNDGTYIVFHSRQTENREVYRIDANGGSPVNLTNNTVDDSNPSW